jgi:hypothetical protein
MDHEVAPNEKDEEAVKRLDDLRDEIDRLRERIECAYQEDRRRQSRPFPWPERRKAA